MAVNLYLKDGSVVNVPDAASAKPWPGDENFMALVDTTGATTGLVAVADVVAVNAHS